MIFDSHAHYDDQVFDSDREEVLASLQKNGVGTVVNVGASLEGTKRTVELTKKYSFPCNSPVLIGLVVYIITFFNFSS